MTEETLQAVRLLRDSVQTRFSGWTIEDFDDADAESLVDWIDDGESMSALDALELDPVTFMEVELQRALAKVIDNTEPDCLHCQMVKNSRLPDGYWPTQRMIVCPSCGNKRCPKATDHALNCTHSNKPEQAGSAYGGTAGGVELRGLSDYEAPPKSTFDRRDLMERRLKNKAGSVKQRCLIHTDATDWCECCATIIDLKEPLCAGMWFCKNGHREIGAPFRSGRAATCARCGEMMSIVSTGVLK